MIDFKPVELSDKEWMGPLLAAADLSGCHQNFTNIFAWEEVYHYTVAKVENYLVVKGLNEGVPYYFYPAGTGDIKPVLQAMKEDAEHHQHEFVLTGLSPENVEALQSIFPDHFEIQELRDGADYVYLLEKLVTLAGRKLQAKRNHINRFKANNQNWQFEPITPKNIAECWEMNRQWCKENDCKDDEQLRKEYCAVSRCFDFFGELKLEGGLIRNDDRVIAFTMGERLNSDTYVVHIEKAFSEIQGAYQMINREFVETVQQKHPDLVYVNREEDMGFEGLRKAKLSYHPDKMEVKFYGKYF
jgi:hypothetical protein